MTGLVPMLHGFGIDTVGDVTGKGVKRFSVYHSTKR